MANSTIQDAVNAVVQKFHNGSTLEETKALMRDSQQLVQDFYARHMGVSPDALSTAAAADPQSMHRLTEEHFGFEVYEQPRYSSIDDYAWQSSQRYTTLAGVDLPDNAAFYDSNRRKLTRDEVETAMGSGEHHLFDVALSNEYVLLGKDEKFSVSELESRFSTNNEHLAPQSKSRQEGNTKVFKSDPRMIIISDMKNNGARGNLQVVFLDDKGHARESVSLLTGPEFGGAALAQNDFNAGRGRYGVSPEDAPHYAYALGLAHFAGGFSQDADRSWFDRQQAQEVARMLTTLAQSPVEANKEPVMRDVLSDAQVLGGNINPVALLPGAFAKALEAELEKGKFTGRQSEEPKGFAARIANQRAIADQQAGLGA
jgi:hypothetical protein